MAERKKHLGTIQVRIQTPSNNTESSIAGGLNEYFTSHMTEEGLSNVLGVITGNDNIKTFKDLAALRVAENSILNPIFTNKVSDVITNIDKNITKSIDSLESINSALNSIALLISENNDKESKDNTVRVVVDTSGSDNLSKIIEAIKSISSNDDVKTALNGLKNIENFFAKLQILFDDNGTVALANEQMTKIFPDIENNVKSIGELIKLYTIINSIGSFDATIIDNAIKSFSNTYTLIGDNLKELVQIDFTDDVNVIKERLQKIKELYDTDIAATAAAINSHSADVQAIKSGTESSYEVAISGNDLDEEDLDTSMDAVAKTIDAIALMGVCMLIGGAIINKYPDLIIGSLKFGATLAAFLLELMIPLALLNKISANIEDSGEIMGSISGFVVISSLIMMIGGAFAMKDRFVKGALRFGLIFGLFLIEILKAIKIGLGGFKDGKLELNLDGLANFITRATLIMTIGGLFMTSSLIIPALKFGLVFGLFLLEILLPLRALRAGTNKEMATLEGVSGLLIVCMGLMFLGAYIVTNTNLVKNALLFGVVFGAFLFFSFAPLWVFKTLSIGLARLIDSVSKLLIRCTLIMLIGALFVSQPRLWQAALKFGVLMGAFIVVTVLPFMLFRTVTKWLWPTILSFTLFIQTVMATMLIGALIVRNPRLLSNILGFGGIVAAFIFIVLLPFKTIKSEMDKSWRTLLALSVFVLVTGHVLKVAAKITSKYGWLAVGGAVIMAGFTLAMVGIMKMLGTVHKTTIANTLLMTIGIAGIVLAISFALKMVKAANVTVRDVWSIIIMMTAVTLMMFMVKMISSGSKNKPKWMQSIVGTDGLTKAGVLNAMILMGGVAATILIIGFTLALVHRFGVTVRDVWSIIIMMTAASVMLLLINHIVHGGTLFGIEVPSSKIDTAKSALLIMVGIAGVILSIGFALKLVSDANVTIAHILSIVTLMLVSVLMLAMVNRIVHGGTLFGIKVPRSKIDTTYEAIAIMGAISLVIISIGYSLKLIADSGANMEHLAILGIMTAVVGGLAILISKFGGINPIQAAGALIVLASLTAIVIGLAYAIRMVATSGANNETLKLIGIMTAVVVALGVLCGAIGTLVTGPQALILGAGVVVIASLIGIVLEMGKAIQAVATAAMMASVAKDKVPALGEFFKEFINVLNGITITDIKTLSTKGKNVSKLLKKMVEPMGAAANLVAQVASLTIPIEWDPNTGKATNFRRLSAADFATASANISLIIGTLAEGLVNTANILFGKGDGNGENSVTYKQLKRTIRITRKIGSTISSIATGLQQYAKLMVADDWTEDGKPKHYTRLTKQDFKNAAENITSIIALLGGTIANIANGKEVTVGGQKVNTSEWIKAMDGTGFFHLGQSNFSKVLHASSSLGKMISNIATGIQAFANMTYADAWDEHGKPISFKRLGESEIKSAQENIISIITATTQPIMELASGEYANLFKEVVETRKKGWGFNENITMQSPFMAVLSGCMGIGEMIANLSLGVQSMANMAIPDKWDETGKPIHYIQMNPDEVFPKVSGNVQNIITAAINGVTDAMKNTDFDSETLSAVLSSVQPVGELVASLARGIKDIAELKIVSKYDEKGNPIEYIPLQKQDFTNMKQNIGEIISGSITAVIAAWDSLDDNYKNTDYFTSIMNAMTNVGAVIEMAAGCVVSLTSGYKDVDGTTHQISIESINKAKSNIDGIFENVITNVISKVSTVYDENKNILNSDAEINIKTVLTTIDSALNVLGRMMKTVSKFNEYTIDATNINKIVGEQGLLRTFVHNVNSFEYVNSTTIDNIISLIGSSVELFDIAAILANKLNEVKTDINTATIDVDATFSNLKVLISSINDITKTALSTYTPTEALNIGQKTLAVNTDIIALTSVIESILEFNKQLDEVNEIYALHFVEDVNTLNKLKNVIKQINTTTSDITAIYKSTDTNNANVLTSSNYNDKLNQLWVDVNFFATAMDILNRTRDIQVTTFSLPSGITSESIQSSIMFMKNIIDTSLIGQLNTISTRSLRNSIEIIESFDEIVLKLINISSHTNTESTISDISIFIKGLKDINEQVDNIDDKKVRLITKEADTLDKFVKTIDAVDVSKVGRMTGLMNSMANLADKMGGFDKVVELLNGDLKNVLDKLSDKITDAKKTIDKAERIENERQKKLNGNIDKIKKLMEQSITVNVGKLDENNNLAAGTETK